MRPFYYWILNAQHNKQIHFTFFDFICDKINVPRECHKFSSHSAHRTVLYPHSQYATTVPPLKNLAAPKRRSLAKCLDWSQHSLQNVMIKIVFRMYTLHN